MAFSSSIRRAQVVKFCELCQQDSIKWSCIDCDMCLCEKCKTSHLKIPVTSQHQIVTTATSVEKKIVTNNIPCMEHPKNMTCVFCRSCDFLICADCVSSSHKKHNFDSIQSSLDEKLDYLGGIQDKVNENLKYCDYKISEINNIKPIYIAIFNESVEKIKEKEQELIGAIKNFSQTLQKQVKRNRKRKNMLFLAVEQEVYQKKKNLEGQKEVIEATLASNQGGIIFKAKIEINDLKLYSFDSLPKEVNQFIPEEESNRKIPELFGSLQKLAVPTAHVFPDVKFEVNRKFTADLPFIDTIVTLNETSAWISCSTNNLIKKVNIQDNNLKTSRKVSKMVYDMVVTRNNDILLSMSKESDIRVLKSSGEIQSFLTVAPLCPLGIHVSKDNQVLVGVGEAGFQYRLTDQSQRAVTVFDMDSKQKQKYQYDKDGKRLFTLPFRITTNINQDILVIDKTSDDTGKIIALNKDGKLKWVYKGHQLINNSPQFYDFDPCDLATTAVGHILVSDRKSNAIHVLSAGGEPLACRVMRNTGITSPMGLDMDNKGRLWLGCHSGISEDTEAKLCILKLIF